MSAGFVLELDTTAPQLVLDAPPVVPTGVVLEVPFTTDEPADIEAVLVLADGDEVALAVVEEALVGLVLSNAATGYAQVRALARDEVWNEAIWLSDLILVGSGPGGVTGRILPGDEGHFSTGRDGKKSTGRTGHMPSGRSGREPRGTTGEVS